MLAKEFDDIKRANAINLKEIKIQLKLSIIFSSAGNARGQDEAGVCHIIVHRGPVTAEHAEIAEV